MKKTLSLITALLCLVALAACGNDTSTPENPSSNDPMFSKKLTDFNGKRIAIVEGSVAKSIIPFSLENTEIKEYDTGSDCIAALKAGEVDGVADDTPILIHEAMGDDTVGVIGKKLFNNVYGFGVSRNNQKLKDDIDKLLDDLKGDGTYHDMVLRWVRTKDSPDMPDLAPSGNTNGTLRFATATNVEPFSYKKDGKTIGFDVELAYRLAQSQNKKLEIIEVPYSELLSSVTSDKADFCGALLTMTEERQQEILFTNQTYEGGISLMVLK